MNSGLNRDTQTARGFCICAESIGERKRIEAMLPPLPIPVVPLDQQGVDLVDTVRAQGIGGVIFQYRSGREAVLDDLQLLEKEVPGCQRLVVCDEHDLPSLRRLKGATPYVLRRGASPEEIADRVLRAVLLSTWSRRPEICSILPRLSTLPTLADSHQRILRELQRTDYSVERVAELIARDVTLTAHVLKIANSALFGLSLPVRTVAEAIPILGASRLQALAMSAWAFFSIQNRPCHGFDPRAEWDHAATVGMESQRLAHQAGLFGAAAEDAFTAGLLHDIGKIVMAANIADHYVLSLDEAAERHRPPWEIELELLGYNHAEIGAYLLGLWGLPLNLVMAVGWHHQPQLAPTPAPPELPLVHRADCQSRGQPAAV